jgi:bifunctional UDP-N-acetylglucosamine pyrophosphorylase / glucosamine-1-phosphate N-acetyltransferase
VAPSSKLTAVVLAAGRSRRFGGTTPKVLQPLSGRTLLGHVLETLREVHRSVRIHEVVVVVPPGKEVERSLDGTKLPFEVAFTTQREPKGTGDATRLGLRRAKVAGSDVLVLAADMPLLRAESLAGLVKARRETKAAASVLTAIDGPSDYGRILREGDWITGVIEARDATPSQLEIREVNTSTYTFAPGVLERVLPKIKNHNVQGELYLTDVIGELAQGGEELTSVEASPMEVLGTNTRSDFASVAAQLRLSIVGELMDGGVTVIDPNATYVDAGVSVGPDTVLHPGTFLEGSTKIGSGCEVGPNVRLVDSTVGDNATVTFATAREAKIGAEASVGPFASLRPGTVLRKGAKAGTFVEMKEADIGEGAKVPHLAYMGDVSVGRESNIGAGTITCNYDGTDKHRTTIGDEVFIGSDTILVAPVRVGRGAYTGAGSVVTRNVSPGDLAYGSPAEPKGKARKPKRKAKKKPAKKRKGG